MKTFKSSYSKGMIVSSMLLSIFILSLEINLFNFMLLNQPDSFVFWFSLFGFISILYYIFYAFFKQIKGLSISEKSLVIIQKRGNIIIPIEDIMEVKIKKNIMWDMSIFGTSGLFGHIGWFRSTRLGNYFALVNNGNTMVYIKTSRRKYVVSCDNRDDFIECLQKAQ